MLNKSKALLYYLSQGNPKVFGIIFISAVFVTIARLLAPIELSWDPAVQLDAAHRLVQGFGLTSTVFPVPEDIAKIPPNLIQSPTPQYLTSFPPGFSILVASLLFLGISLASSLKIIYSITTLLGWFAWSIIGSHCLLKPIQLGSILFPAQLLLAAILPLFYTPGWVGTDIFLWAALPFMILLLFKSNPRDKIPQQQDEDDSYPNHSSHFPFFKSEFKGSLKLSYVVAAGLIFGFQFSLRYAVLFFSIAAFLILFQVHFPHIKNVVKSYLVFLLSSVFFIVPVAVYIKLANAYNGKSGLPQVSFESQYSGFFNTIEKLVHSSSAIANISGLPIQTKLAYQIDPKPSIYFIGTFFLVFTLTLPLIVFYRNKQATIESIKGDIGLSLAFVPLTLVLFLIATNFAGQYDFLGTPRYYVPVFLPTLFVSYQLAVSKFQRLYRVIKIYLKIFIILFLLYNLVLSPLGWSPGNSIVFQGIRERVATDILQNYLKFRADYRYPSNQVITLHDETSDKVRELHKKYPEALFFVQEYPFYIYDGYPGLRVIPMDEFWQKAYVDRAVKVFWIVGEKCPAVCTEHGGTVIERLGNQPGLKPVFVSSKGNKESMKILESDLPSGYKF